MRQIWLLLLLMLLIALVVFGGRGIKKSKRRPPSLLMQRGCLMQFDDLERSSTAKKWSKQKSNIVPHGNWIFNPSLIRIVNENGVEKQHLCARTMWVGDNATSTRHCLSIRELPDQQKCMQKVSKHYVQWGSTICGDFNQSTCRVRYLDQDEDGLAINSNIKGWNDGWAWFDTRLSTPFAATSGSPDASIVLVMSQRGDEAYKANHYRMKSKSQFLHVNIPTARRLVRLVYYDPHAEPVGQRKFHFASGATALYTDWDLYGHYCAYNGSERTVPLPPYFPLVDPSGGGEILEHEKMHVNKVEDKNWGSFVYQGQLLFSYQIEPHTVCALDEDVLNREKKQSLHTDCALCVRKYVSSGEGKKIDKDASSKGGIWSVFEKTLLAQLKEEDFASRISSKHFRFEKHLNGVSAYHLPSKGVYISTGHVIITASNPNDTDPRPYRSYSNYFFLFQDKPPFAITSLSCPLKLIKRVSVGGIFASEERVRFVSFISGFHVSLRQEDIDKKQEVLISYGVGDSQSVVTRISLDEALDHFNLRKCGATTNTQ